MSLDNLIQTQVEEALQPVLAELNVYIEKFSKLESYKNVQIGAAEAARLLGRSVRMIHIYVDEGELKPINPKEKCKKFTLEEIDRFMSKSLVQRRKDI
ncbi:helix-turn-helix domain-containing protein [Thiotrichales bacterium 19X7-9]|nr:helix-turn-helix domain-containing protein [Thiotrichales bacterium 19X7-9]